MNAHDLLANQQKDGDSLVKMGVQGLQEKSWLRIMDELRRFISVDNHEAVKVGDLKSNLESLEVVKSKFAADFLETVVREEKERACCAHPPTQRMCETTDGSRRSRTRTGMLCVKPFSKVLRDPNEKPCSTRTRSCIMRSTARNQRKKSQGTLGTQRGCPCLLICRLV